jgi:hypothetical protein
VAKLDFEAFRFDSDLERYESTVEIDGAAIAVRVAAEAFEDKGRLDDVVAVVERQGAHFLSRVVEELLEDKNEGWLKHGEDPLSEQDFRRRLALEAVEISSDGEVEVLVGDDGMFWGHQVIVNLDPAYEITRIDLEG